MESKKKGHEELLCRTDTDSQNLWFPKKTGWGWGDALRVWDGNGIKFCWVDHCTTINVIKFFEKKKRIKSSMKSPSLAIDGTYGAARESGGHPGLGNESLSSRELGS